MRLPMQHQHELRPACSLSALPHFSMIFVPMHIQTVLGAIYFTAKHARHICMLHPIVGLQLLRAYILPADLAHHIAHIHIAPRNKVAKASSGLQNDACKPKTLFLLVVIKRAGCTSCHEYRQRLQGSMGSHLYLTLVKQPTSHRTIGWWATDLGCREALGLNLSTIPTCKNPEATLPESQLGLPRWEASSLTTTVHKHYVARWNVREGETSVPSKNPPPNADIRYISQRETIGDITAVHVRVPAVLRLENLEAYNTLHRFRTQVDVSDVSLEVVTANCDTAETACGVGGGETGDPRENLSTSSIIWHDSHMQKSGVNWPGIEPISPWWEASSLTAEPPWPCQSLPPHPPPPQILQAAQEASTWPCSFPYGRWRDALAGCSVSETPCGRTCTTPNVRRTASCLPVSLQRETKVVLRTTAAAHHILAERQPQTTDDGCLEENLVECSSTGGIEGGRKLSAVWAWLEGDGRKGTQRCGWRRGVEGGMECSGVSVAKGRDDSASGGRGARMKKKGAASGGEIIRHHSTTDRPPGRGAVVVRLLTSHLGEPGLIPGRVTLEFHMWESCRVMLLVSEFSQRSPVSPALSFHIISRTGCRDVGSCLVESNSSAWTRASCMLRGVARRTASHTSMLAMASKKKPTVMMLRAFSEHPTRDS
ncbi:hypothetical protein PR048_032465 [Dryococelus australis]|uniref:Uncharacterized protein n=1 Tax=Dryococelus australis TaxID=614101 RepID=A0ABQ9G298_9NEOP|nr:hypothetical protein PR048_032465 [Dryococelus australis]